MYNYRVNFMRNPLKKSAHRSIRFFSAVISAILVGTSLAPLLAAADTIPVPPPGITPAGGLAVATSSEGAGDSGSYTGSNGWNWRSHQSSQIQQEISTLPSTATQSVMMPVLFGVGLSNISPNFGDPRPGGRTHEGEDIMAERNTPIVSPTPAVVLRVETGVSEGNTVYTANPGGETFVYMHLDHFGEGVVVGTMLQTGSLIGYVGNTGDAAGGATHLHFEIHNAAGAPTDPFPRLTSEIPLAQKMSDLATILGATADPTTLSNLLVTNFRRTFTDAVAQNISVPTQIITALSTVPVTAVASTARSLPTGDMDVGSSGMLVVLLQQYLIQSAVGPAAKSLSQAGATGDFGNLTKAALAEFQAHVGISPADGYYGPTTKAYIDSHTITTMTTVPVSNLTPIQPAIVAISGTSVTLSRSLVFGMSGDDVRALQKSLNARGYIIATSGVGSAGNESTYFGRATQAAVIKFQIAQNIAPAAGYVGPITRAALAK